MGWICVQIYGGSRLWRSATSVISKSGARERPRGHAYCCAIETNGREACERDGGGREGGGAVRERLEGGFVVRCARETRRGEGVFVCVVSFGKWFTEKKFHKPFSVFF
jgi:hypothetical protein